MGLISRTFQNRALYRPKERTQELPKWPPSWNPFEVFILMLAIPAAYPLIHGHSGSTLLDERLSSGVVILWGASLGIGAVMALIGVWCYRTARHLVPGLWLESGGLFLVGLMCAIYAYIVWTNASDVDGVTHVVATQTGFASACFLRSYQGYRALYRTRRIYLQLNRRRSPDGN